MAAPEDPATEHAAVKARWAKASRWSYGIIAFGILLALPFFSDVCWTMLDSILLLNDRGSLPALPGFDHPFWMPLAVLGIIMASVGNALRHHSRKQYLKLEQAEVGCHNSEQPQEDTD